MKRFEIGKYFFLLANISMYHVQCSPKCIMCANEKIQSEKKVSITADLVKRSVSKSREQN